MWNETSSLTIGSIKGRALAQAVSRRLPTAADPDSRPGQVMWDLWWTKWHWAEFSPSIFGFPCQFLSHRLLHTHHLSTGAGTRGQFVSDVPSELILTPPQET
jgi:hypothetical protein